MSLRDDVEAAMEKLREPQVIEPTPRYGPLHPEDYARVQADLGLTRPLTDADLDEYVRRAFDRADESGKARLLAASFGIVE